MTSDAGGSTTTICQSYWAGHNVHFIQARLSRESLEAGLARSGRIIAIGDDGRVDVAVAGATVELWNHLPARLRRFVEHGKTDVVLRGHSAMAIGSYLFSVRDATDDDAICCTAHDPGDFT